MNRKIARYLRDVLQRIDRVERYVEGMEYEAFVRDEKTRDAVLRNFEIMGEAVKRIPEDVRNQHSDVPWKEIAGMRDVLIHQYDQVDERIVWKTIQQRFPALKPILRSLLEQRERER